MTREASTSLVKSLVVEDEVKKLTTGTQTRREIKGNTLTLRQIDDMLDKGR